MSIWKTITPSDISKHTIVVHKQFNLDSGSHGQSFTQFKSGSSTNFEANQSGSYWDSNRLNFYLSGSQFHFSSATSSFHQNGFYGSPDYSLGTDNTVNPQYRHKFHSTGSTLSISQYYFGDGIRRGSFKLTDNSHTSGTVEIIDDGYGNLYAPSASLSSSGDTAISSSDNYIGNIFYNLGIVNITETGSYSHTSSTATITAVNTKVSHSQEIHISASDLSTTFQFVINSGSVTGSDDTNRFYITSASGHPEVTSSFITMLSMSKKINEQFNLDSPTGSYISASCEDSLSFSTNPVLTLTNAQADNNRPIHNIDNLPPITASLVGTIGLTTSGFSGGTSPINYTNIGTGNNGGINSGSYDITFDSTHTITSRVYKLKVNKQDFNFTNNLSAKRFGTVPETLASQSLFHSPYLRDDILSGSLSGSWGPCMTTIGFYRKYPGTDIMDNHPIMVAKYPSPIMITKDADIIFEIKIDF